jgi:hypothetical protein
MQAFQFESAGNLKKGSSTTGSPTGCRCPDDLTQSFQLSQVRLSRPKISGTGDPAFHQYREGDWFCDGGFRGGPRQISQPAGALEAMEAVWGLPTPKTHHGPLYALLEAS